MLAGPRPPSRPPLDEPLLLRPRYVAKPWGGRRLEEVLGRTDVPDGPVGESWEAADLSDFTSVVEGGPRDGEPLRVAWGGPFPLLVKVLDAREDLSVQVHPDGRDGPPAKEEVWVALAEGGGVARGSPGEGPLPAPGRWLDRLAHAPLRGAGPARPPTIVHVPPGTVHAVLSGALLWEVQTPVDVTWRLDDHGRVGLDGTPRPTHLAQAAALLRREPEPVVEPRGDGRSLRGRRLEVWSHPPGTWHDVPGIAAFLLRGGEAVGAGSSSRLEVPPGRTVVLPPGGATLRSPGWMLAAGPRG